MQLCPHCICHWNTIHMFKPRLPFTHCYRSWLTEAVSCFDIRLKMTMRPLLNLLLVCRTFLALIRFDVCGQNLNRYKTISSSDYKWSPSQESLRISHTRFMLEMHVCMLRNSQQWNSGNRFESVTTLRFGFSPATGLNWDWEWKVNKR